MYTIHAAAMTEHELRLLNSAIHAVAGEIIHAAGVTEPPVDALAVARHLGLAVLVDDRTSGRARTVRLKHRAAAAGCVLLRPEPRSQRRQWAVAHEIGEQLAGEIFARAALDVDEMPELREQAANRFAAHLLLPGDWFTADGRELDWNLAALKERYHTASHELIARRMLELGPPAIVSIFDQGRLYLRHGGHGRPPPLTPLETECWRAVHAGGHFIEQRAGQLHIRGWAIHEPEWLREILHTMYAED